VANFLNLRLGRCNQLGIIWYRVHTQHARADRSSVRTPVGARFYLLQNVHTCPGPHPTSCTIGTVSLSWW